MADHLRRCPKLGGVGITLASEEGVSGPEYELVERAEDPFSRGETDVGFLCAPTYLWLREREPPSAKLAVAPVFADERCRGEPVYFCDVVVGGDSPARSLWDLEGGVWAYNDPCSLSGHGGLAARLGSVGEGGEFFGRKIQSGSHLASVRLVAEGGADAASIDSNALRILLDRAPTLRNKIRILESWGPYPIQPVVVRSGLDPVLGEALRESLLETEADSLTRRELAAFGLQRFVAVGEEGYATVRLPSPPPGR